MPGRNCPRRALAMHPNVAELGMPLELDQIVADLVHEIGRRAEHRFECQRDLLDDDQPIDDCKIPAGRDGVEIASIKARIRRKIAEVQVLDCVRLFSAREIEIIRRQAVPEPTAAGMYLYEQRLGLFAALQLNEMIAAPEAAELPDAAFRFSAPGPGRLPSIVDR